MKRAIMSNCKDPENRSKKNCICGGHSTKAKNAKKNKRKRKRVDWPSWKPYVEVSHETN